MYAVERQYAKLVIRTHAFHPTSRGVLATSLSEFPLPRLTKNLNIKICKHEHRLLLYMD